MVRRHNRLLVALYVVSDAILAMWNLLRQATRWLLNQGRQINDIEAVIKRLAPGTFTNATVGVQMNLPIFSGFAVQNRVKETVALEERSRNRAGPLPDMPMTS